MEKKSKDPEITKLKTLIDLCRKHGVEAFEGLGFKFSLNPTAQVKSAYRRKKDAAGSDLIPAEQYTEEQILNWSSAGLDGEGA